MLGALAHGKHVGHGYIAGTTRQIVSHDDAPVDFQAGVGRERRVGTDARGDHDQVASQPAAIGEFETLDMPISQDGGRPRGEMCRETHLLELAAKHIGRARIELRLHQVRHQVDHVRLETPVQQATGRLQSQQPSADHRGRARGRRGAHDALAIVQRAKHEHALLERPCSSRTLARGGMTGLLPVAITSLSYCSASPSARDHLLRAHVDPFDPLACMQRDVPGRIPGHRVDEDVIGLVAAREHAREKNTVVVAARLVAEHHDIEAVSAAATEEIVHKPRARHAVADDDEALFTHRCRFAPRTP